MLLMQLTINSITESLLWKNFRWTEESSESPQLMSLSFHSILESLSSRYEPKPPWRRSSWEICRGSFAHLLWNPNVQCNVQKNLPLDLILSQSNPFHIPTLYLWRSVELWMPINRLLVVPHFEKLGTTVVHRSLHSKKILSLLLTL